MNQTDEILNIIKELNIPFWESVDFWIFLVLAVAGLIFSMGAFYQAKRARLAADEAGKTVKIQTITIELSEIIQKLDKLEMNITYPQARDFSSEINRRIKRLTAPFREDDEYKDIIISINEILDKLKESLTGVRPIDQSEGTQLDSSVYYAIESHLSDLGGQLAILMGYFEKRTLKK